MVIGACLWIPVPLWKELGGFPDWFESIAEDLYLCCRARLAGSSVYALQRSGYRHHVGGTFGGGKITGNRLVTTTRRRALSERNKTFAMIICQPLAFLLVLLPLHIILVHLEGLAMSLIRRSMSLWLRIYAPLVPSLWEKRKEIWATRRIAQSTRKTMLRNWLAAFRWTPWKLTMLYRHGLPNVK
jgi:GT2 family glycosyltransferase